MAQEFLVVRGAREHNLKNISVSIPRDRLTVITGLSGSGKSSLAFDTIYAEGQRRYVESLSAYARQFLGLMEKPDVDAHRGALPGDLDRAEDRRPESALHRRHRHRDLRLPAPALGARRHAALPQRRHPGRAPERGADHRRGARAGPKEPGSRCCAPLVRGRKGEFRDLFEDVRKRGFVRVRVDGETYDLATVAGAEPPAESRHRGRGGPAGGARRGPRAAHRLDRDRAQARRRRRRGGSHGRHVAERESDTLLRALRLPGVRALAARAGAAPVLLQLALRRLPGLPRPRHPARGERRAHPRRSAASRSSRACPPLGRAVRLPAQGRAPDAGARRSSSISTRRGASSAPRRSRRSCTARRDDSSSRPTARAGGRVRERVGRHAAERRAPVPASRPATRCGRELEEFMVELPCQTCGGTAPQAGEPGGAGRRARASATWWSCRSTEPSRSSRASRCAVSDGPAAGRRRPGDRRADPEGGARPAALPARRRARLPHARPRRRRRSPAARPSASGWRPRSARASSGVLYILDEPSIGLHQRDNERLLATLRELRDLGQHGHRGGARRGHHRGRRPRHRPRPARRPLRRRGGRGGHGRRRSWRIRASLTGALPAGRAPDARAGRPPRGAGQAPPPHRRGAREQSAEPDGGHPARRVHRGDRRVGLGEVDARHRHPVPGAGPAFLPRQGGARRARVASTGSTTSTRSSTSTRVPSAGRRARTRRRTPGSSRRSASSSPSCPRPRCAATARAGSRST